MKFNSRGKEGIVALRVCLDQKRKLKERNFKEKMLKERKLMESL
jgi:hypothetical protein